MEFNRPLPMRPDKSATQIVTDGLRSLAYDEQFSRSRDYVPDSDRAAAELAAARERVAERERPKTAAEERLEAVQAQAAERAAATQAARERREMSRAAATAAKESEAAAFATGETPTVDPVALEAQFAADDRRVGVLETMEHAFDEPLKKAQADVDRADDLERTAKFWLARARVMNAAAPRIHALVDEVAPLLHALAQARQGGGKEIRDVGHREERRVRDQLARSLAAILPHEINRITGGRPARRHAATAESLVEMVVRPGETYGDAPAGSRVLVTEDEAALQQRRGHLGEFLGALCTPEEYEQLTEKSDAVDSRPRSASERLVDAVQLGLSRLAAIGRREEAEKASAKAEKKAIDSALIRMAEHAAHVGDIRAPEAEMYDRILSPK